MKALLCKAFGPPENLVIEEVSDLTPDADEVIMSVKAAGLNFPDTLIIQGKYQFQPDLPFSPGGEAAGIVHSVGTNVTHLKVGDRVVGGTSWGSFAEQVRCRATNAFKIPDNLSFEQAAGSLMTYATSYHALKDRASLQSGERLLVLGAAGGVGTAAIQLGRLLGAEVIACASSEGKLAHCKTQGANHLVNYEDIDLKLTVKQIMPNGVDVIFDPVGGDLSEQAFRSIARGGRHLVVGFASGSIPKMPWNLPLLKSAAIVGVFWGGFFRNEPGSNRENVEQLMDWFARGELKSSIHRAYPLEKVPQAMKALLNKEVMGKVVISI